MGAYFRIDITSGDILKLSLSQKLPDNMFGTTSVE